MKMLWFCLVACLLMKANVQALTIGSQGSIRGEQYTLFLDEVSQADALTECQNLGALVSLASFDSVTAYNLIRSLRNSAGLPQTGGALMWIGINLTRSSEGPSTNPSDFSFIDGSTAGLKILHTGAAGDVPWSAAPPQPSGSGACVVWGTFDLIFDSDCDVKLPFICKESTPPPTAAPTQVAGSDSPPVAGPQGELSQVAVAILCFIGVICAGFLVAAAYYFNEKRRDRLRELTESQDQMTKVSL